MVRRNFTVEEYAAFSDVERQEITRHESSKVAAGLECMAWSLDLTGADQLRMDFFHDAPPIGDA